MMQPGYYPVPPTGPGSGLKPVTWPGLDTRIYLHHRRTTIVPEAMFPWPGPERVL